MNAIRDEIENIKSEAEGFAQSLERSINIAKDIRDNLRFGSARAERVDNALYFLCEALDKAKEVIEEIQSAMEET